MNENNKSLAYIHAAVFLFGFSAIFARLIEQNAIIITFARVFFSSIFLLGLVKYRQSAGNQQSLNINKPDSKKDLFLFVVSGIILALHWYFFIYSIQLSSVAIGTITFAAFPVFTAFLEPLVFREKIKFPTVLCTLLMLAGIFIISPVFKGQEANLKIGSSGAEQRLIGIIVGLVSSLAYSVLSLFNRRFSKKYKSEIIVFYEQATAAILLLPFVFVLKPVFSLRDLLLLAALGVVFTAIAHGLFVKGLRRTKAATAGIISALEAVYAVVLASLLLREFPAVNEIIGGLVVILLAVFITINKEKEAVL